MEINRIDGETMQDDGCFKSYSLDMAYGEDENDFAIEMDNDTVSFKAGDLWYIEGSEYGGIIDGPKISTASNTVSYCGRTWQGLLESKIIQPPAGAAYYEVSGDANVVIGNLIEYIGLGSIFCASKEAAPVIEPCGVRYEPTYSALYRILINRGMKLHIEPCAGDDFTTKIELSAVSLLDYSVDEEWDSSQLSLEIDDVDVKVNHLICLGSGNLADRNVIHIFCDQNGTVQPTANTSIPIKDSDYILDESRKVISGINEIIETYDYPNIESVENYEVLASEPADWSVQPNYYRKVGDKYETLSNVSVTRYSKLSAQPDDWVTGYTNYYQIANGAYSVIPEQSQYSYQMQSSQPSDWATNYANYYYYVSDGTSYSYEKAKSDSEEYYEVQTMMPSDWTTSFASYYEVNGGQYLPASIIRETRYSQIADLKHVKETCIRKLFVYDMSGNCKYDKTTYYASAGTIMTLIDVYGELYGYNENYKSKYGRDYYVPLSKVMKMVTAGYEKYAADTIAKEFGINIYRAKFDPDMKDEIGVIKYDDLLKLYYQYEYTQDPIWKAGYYYTKKSRSIAPPWASNTYYTLVETHNPPDFHVGKYYEMYVESIPNKFVANKYYRKHIDHYKNLVEAGIEKMKELRVSKSVEANISGDYTYDIGDVVGINEVQRGLIIKRRIVKKIVKSTGDEITTSYKLGEC